MREEIHFKGADIEVDFWLISILWSEPRFDAKMPPFMKKVYINYLHIQAIDMTFLPRCQSCFTHHSGEYKNFVTYVYSLQWVIWNSERRYKFSSHSKMKSNTYQWKRQRCRVCKMVVVQTLRQSSSSRHSSPSPFPQSTEKLVYFFSQECRDKAIFSSLQMNHRR